MYTERKPITREIRLKAILELVPQKKRAYYERAFEQIEAGYLITFNLGAAFWSFMWFFYHRMMLWGWVALFVFMGVEHAGELILGIGGEKMAIETIDFFAPIIVSILGMGLFANKVYYNHLNNIVRQSWFSRGHLLPEETWHQSLRKKGGVDMKSAVFATIMGMTIYLVKTFLLMYLGVTQLPPELTQMQYPY